MSNTASDPGPPVGTHRVLHAGTRKWLTALIIAAAFVAIGIAMIITKGDFLAWFVTLFFALVAAVALLQLTGAGARLTLDAHTFTVRYFGRHLTERWDECANFTVYRVSYSEHVVYDRARDVETHTGEMNRSLSGRSAGLPDTFGMTAKDLADLMNAYQADAVARSWQRHAEAVRKTLALFADEPEDDAIPTIFITDNDAMDLPPDMAPWPSILALDKSVTPGEPRRILQCTDVLSPLSRWIPLATKQEDAFEKLGAQTMQIVDPDTLETDLFLRSDDIEK